MCGGGRRNDVAELVPDVDGALGRGDDDVVAYKVHQFVCFVQSRSDVMTRNKIIITCVIRLVHRVTGERVRVRVSSRKAGLVHVTPSWTCNCGLQRQLRLAKTPCHNIGQRRLQRPSVVGVAGAVAGCGVVVVCFFWFFFRCIWHHRYSITHSVKIARSLTLQPEISIACRDLGCELCAHRVNKTVYEWCFAPPVSARVVERKGNIPSDPIGHLLACLRRLLVLSLGTGGRFRMHLCTGGEHSDTSTQGLGRRWHLQHALGDTPTRSNLTFSRKRSSRLRRYRNESLHTAADTTGSLELVRGCPRVDAVLREWRWRCKY